MYISFLNFIFKVKFAIFSLELLITSLENKQKDKMKEKEKAIAEMIEKENQAKKNIEKFMVEQEKIRLQFEKEIHDKSKLISI